MERLHAPVRYFGGKGSRVAQLLRLVPPGGRPYAEPYCGSAALLFARDPAPVEVLNDRDERIVNLFRCLQNRETFEELRHRLMWTPYARAEFARALTIMQKGSPDPVEQAWAYFVVQNQACFPGSVRDVTPGEWSRTWMSSSGMAKTTSKWLMRLSQLDAYRWRLLRVQIDCRDALEVIASWDHPDAVWYVDPPYHPETRRSGRYAHEMTAADHDRLITQLLACAGAVVLSGYDHPAYRRLDEAGWSRVEYETSCQAIVRRRDSAYCGSGSVRRLAPRTEVVWRNPVATARLPIALPPASPQASEARAARVLKWEV